MEGLSSKLKIKMGQLDSAHQELLEELKKLGERCQQREAALATREASLKAREIALRNSQHANREKNWREGEKIEDLKYLQQVESLMKSEKQLKAKEDILRLGQKTLYNDIKLHQQLMSAGLEEPKVKAMGDRLHLYTMLAEELKSFKLPTADTLFKSGAGNNSLIRKIKDMN